MNVKVFESNGWYSTFLVDENVQVKTIDIYTYMCTTCEDKMSCKHVKDVECYIEAKMEKDFA